MKKSLLFAVVIVLIGSANLVQAGFITVKNLSTNTMIFQDDGFESISPGSVVPNGPTTVGSWSHPSQTTATGAGVSNAASPGPFDGLNYLKMNRTGASNTSRLEAIFSSIPSVGDTIRVEFAFQYEASSAAIALMSGATQRTAIIAEPDFSAPNFYLQDDDASLKTPTSFPVTTGQWQTIAFDYTIGDTLSDMTLTVNGNSQVLAGSGTGGTIDRLRFNGAAGSAIFYIDAIPEPASVILIGIGSLLGLCGRIRSRDRR
jgi:hypothetical protein